MDAHEVIRKIVGINKPIPRKTIFNLDWMSWYRGKVRGFHNYRIYNGTNYLDMERKSLQMAKQICESWANLLMNEKCDVVLPEGKKDKLDAILQETNFWVKANGGVESAFALGYGAFVVNVKGLQIGERSRKIVPTNKTKIKIDYVSEPKIHPITIEDGEVTECAFVSENSDSQHIVVHTIASNGNYMIYNVVLDHQGEIVSEYEFDTKADIPWFYIVRPNIASNLLTEHTDEQIGVSVFANSIDTLRAIDNKYDGFDWEFVLGRKRMFVASEAWTINHKDGEMTKTFDPYDTLFYQLPESNDGSPILNDSTSELRHLAYVQSVNQELDYLSMKCGLGESYFRFDGSGVATATQVISENSTLYRNVKKHEIVLERVLTGLTRAIIHAANVFTNDPIGDVAHDEIVIKFDDSIIEDRGAEMERDRIDVAAGLMSREEYRMKWYAEDDDTARQSVHKYFFAEELNKMIPALEAGVITPTLFVERMYPNEKNKQEIIDYITAFLAPPSVEPSPFDDDEEGEEVIIDGDDEEGEPTN